MTSPHSMNRIMPGYYDYVLGAIPLALFGLTGLLSVSGLSLTSAVPLAAAVAVLLIGHAMFVRGPVSPGSVDGVEEVSTPQTARVNAD